MLISEQQLKLKYISSSSRQAGQRRGISLKSISGIFQWKHFNVKSAAHLTDVKYRIGCKDLECLTQSHQ